MADRSIDDKSSDTLVAGLRLRVLDGEFNSPPSPPDLDFALLGLLGGSAVRCLPILGEHPRTGLGIARIAAHLDQSRDRFVLRPERVGVDDVAARVAHGPD